MKRLLYLFGLMLLFSCQEESSDGYLGYSFVVAGHTYGTPTSFGEPSPTGLYTPFLSKLKEISDQQELYALFLNGDVVHRAEDLKWQQVALDLEQYTFRKEYIAGNHDYYGYDHYQTRFKNSYRAFSHKGDHYIILDGMLAGWSIRDEQYDFLKDYLYEEDNTAKDLGQNLFVFVHQPLWVDAAGFYEGIQFNSMEHREVPVNFYDSIVPLFEGSSATSVNIICGDMGAVAGRKGYFDHQYSEKIRFLGTGMGGGTDDCMMLVTLDPTGKAHFKKIAL